MAVARPENLVIPVGGLPAQAFFGISFFQVRDEPRFEVLSIAVKEARARSMRTSSTI